MYVYHQMATGELYHVKCDAPRQAGSNLPIVSCTQVRAWGGALRGGQAGPPRAGRGGWTALWPCHNVCLPCVGCTVRGLAVHRWHAPRRTPLQAQDNSKGPGGTQGVTDELMLTLINLTGRAIPAGTTNVYFNLAVATLGSP